MIPSQHNVLEIRDLTIALPPGGDRDHAIEKVSLSVGSGELVCVVGESGSGKSVTAFATMGLLPGKSLRVTEGSLRLKGEDILSASPARLRQLRGSAMGMVFQEPMTALNPVLTVGDQIDEMLRIHSLMNAAERKSRVLEIMAAMNLPDPPRLYHAFPHQLSGGQRQRVVIAAAMVLEPALLIADEPTTALDVTTQAQILRLMKDLQSRLGVGILFITHDFGVVADVADRVVVMQSGRVVEQGPVQDVLCRPSHPYTKALIAAVPGAHPPERSIEFGQSAVAVEGLNKVYGKRTLFRRERVVKAAQDVSFDLRRRETIGIVGESGSGKSTVARCVARLIQPTGGSIRLGDLEVASIGERQLRPHRRRLQVVFQDPYRSLNPRRSVAESMIEGPMNYQVSKEVAMGKAQELMRLVGLPVQSLDRFPHQFSGGQRQRIAIARALIMEPDVLIADEAVSALDVSVQKQVLQLLDDVRQRFDLSILFITHDLRVAAQVCDSILVMQHGRVVEQGSARNVFAKPSHPYTKQLIEAAPGRGQVFGGD